MVSKIEFPNLSCWNRNDNSLDGKVVGLTASSFDLLHAGHILMLEEARSQCDYLIVGLQTDPSIDRKEKNKPVQTLEERFIQLKAVVWIDEIFIYDTEKALLDAIKRTKHSVRIIGEEYRDIDFTGKQYNIDNNIKIYYNSRDHEYSSSSLRERVAHAYNKK